ncbi:MAG TPA: glycosyltransferase family 10 domain-containing protein [Candidatus Brocadiaceae bacterium]|nr:hypothetical protein [Candidatus Woesearchaeota archaeon]
MKTILILSTSGNTLFDPDVRDNITDQFIYLRDRLHELGYELKTADNNPLDNCEWVLFIDQNSVKPYSGWRGLARKMKSRIKGKRLFRDLYNECIHAGMQQRMALLLMEPPSVIPENWDSKFHEMFPLIFTWHDNYIDEHKFVKIYLTQTRLFPGVPEISFSNKKLLVTISINKFSKHPRELYSARRESIRYFERKQPEGFDLYGVGWNKPINILEKTIPYLRQNYPSYRGKVQNKWDVLPYYRFGLCYENILDEPGWITEKIFDCMRSKCVPIYWGAANVTKYVDKDAFIDRRLFKSNEELEEYLIHMTEKDYNRFQEAMQDYINSQRFDRFLPPEFSDTIIKGLGL